MVSRATVADLQALAQAGSLTLVRRPVIERLAAPRRVQVGEACKIAWATSGATSVEFELVTAVHNTRAVVLAVGEVVLVPSLAGTIQATLKLLSDESPDAPPVMQSAFTDVLAPRVGLRLSAAEVEAAPGNWTRLHWTAPGAHAVHVRRPSREAERRGPPSGWVDVEVAWVDEAIVFIAVDRHGRELDRARCVVKPLSTSRDEVAVGDDLAALLQPLAEWSNP